MENIERQELSEPQIDESAIIAIDALTHQHEAAWSEHDSPVDSDETLYKFEIPSDLASKVRSVFYAYDKPVRTGFIIQKIFGKNRIDDTAFRAVKLCLVDMINAGLLVRDFDERYRLAQPRRRTARRETEAELIKRIRAAGIPPSPSGTYGSSINKKTARRGGNHSRNWR